MRTNDRGNCVVSFEQDEKNINKVKFLTKKCYKLYFVYNYKVNTFLP